MNFPEPAKESRTSLPEGDWLAPCNGHRVWWCEGGDAQGVPVLVVHGGPGGSSRLEPTRWLEGLPVRWIALDQRGCGRSQPLGQTEANTLDALLGDMERLREHLRLPRWALLGGSWGALVSLAYAARWPERVAGLMLRSPFFGTPAETRRYIAAWPQWLGESGHAWLGQAQADALLALYSGASPGSREALLPGTVSDSRNSLAGWAAEGVQAMPMLVATPTPPDDGASETQEQERLARCWQAFDDAQSHVGGVAASGARFDAGRLAPATPQSLAAWRVHAHFALQGFGLAGKRLAVPKELAVPMALVWGEADATCDPTLARALANGALHLRARAVAGAGHRMSDPQLAPALAEAAREWVGELALQATERQRNLR